MSRLPDPDLAELRQDSRVVWTEDLLRFNDTDLNGHVNNAVFATICETGRVTILHDRLGAVLRTGGFFVVVRLAIEFRAELHYPGRVRCGTWIADVGRSSVTFRQALLAADGRLAATSEAVTVAMEAATRRPRPLDDETRAMIVPLVRA